MIWQEAGVTEQVWTKAQELPTHQIQYLLAKQDNSLLPTPAGLKLLIYPLPISPSGQISSSQWGLFGHIIYNCHTPSLSSFLAFPFSCYHHLTCFKIISSSFSRIVRYESNSIHWHMEIQLSLHGLLRRLLSFPCWIALPLNSCVWCSLTHHSKQLKLHSCCQQL